jgi:hypothetical protein
MSISSKILPAIQATKVWMVVNGCFPHKIHSQLRHASTNVLDLDQIEYMSSLLGSVYYFRISLDVALFLVAESCTSSFVWTSQKDFF